MFKKISLFGLLLSVLAFFGTASAQVSNQQGPVTTSSGFGLTIDWGAIITSAASTYWLWIGSALVPLMAFVAVKGGFRWVFGTVKSMFGTKR